VIVEDGKAAVIVSAERYLRIINKATGSASP
jgi:hypothetical protein